MKALILLKYLLLFLLFCNFTAFALVYMGPGMGSLVSYSTSLLLLVYYFFSKPWHKPAIPFVIFSVLYFTITSFNYTEIDTTNFFMKESLRFMIAIICGAELMYRCKPKDFFYIFLIGAFSVILNAVVFPEANVMYDLIRGRYSGFYLNPNSAGSACLFGFALSYTIKSKTWRLLGQFAFTLGGIVTLSRTFVIVWLLINVIAIAKDKKNILVPIIGGIVLLGVFTFTDTKIFASDRFDALESIFDEGPVQTKTLEQDSRTSTWAMYYDMIMDKPIFGHGFMKLQRKNGVLPGVHNTYLMVIGESGIIPFLLLIGLYGYLLMASFKLFKTRPELFYIMVIVSLAMLVSHTYFFAYNNVLLSMYVYLELRKIRELEK
ncbi:O-Antigen ligase [Pricia antarctica]|uniref:O-Antigen ligase n=2 Tax=Pricia antarctica TaxID=641691 RepID=A0A1G7FKG7_9FLAO|nr:O-Antigen ligase [Pricia antarctica]